jgi:hypothetical protein
MFNDAFLFGRFTIAVVAGLFFLADKTGEGCGFRGGHG